MSTRADVEVSYSVDNEFFRLWLDEAMNYTCAVYDSDCETDSLERAQVRKLDLLADFAGVGPDTYVLDIGCGWGANLEHLVTRRGVREAHGITLSTAQYDELRARQLPGVTAELCDYRDFAPARRFDAAFCICMMEHIATPEQARRREHIALYRDFFARVHGWTNRGARFALQTILRNRVPRDPEHLRASKWTTEKIFPDGITPRMEDIVQAVNPYWEIVEVRTRRLDYQQTTAEWLRRLRNHEARIRARWGDELYDDYDRYLAAASTSFALHYQSLAQWKLRRIDDTEWPTARTRGATTGAMPT